MKQSKAFRNGYNAGDFVSSALSGWLFAICMMLVNEGGGIEALVDRVAIFTRTPEMIALIVGITLFFTIGFSELIVLSPYGRRIVAVFLLVEYAFFAFAIVLSIPAAISEIAVLFAFLILLVPIVLRLVSTFSEGKESAPVEPVSRKKGCFAPVLIFGIAVSCLFGSAIAAIGVMRYLGYSAPNFDFGIFCQMFANMAKTGTPVTTVERDGLLSHFAVHTSPVLYLLLPFYFVFRTPITLAVGQAVILYSSIVPLLLIGRRRGLSNGMLILLSVAFAAYPAIATGCYYDFHENCFLLPLLLWTFWFSECRRPIPFFLFALLTLTVKEDAFVYLLIFALFLWIAERRWKTALPTALLAVGYFLIVSHLMKQNGEGVMSWRYSNLLPDGEEGLFGVVLTVFTNPGYVMTQILTSTAGDASKFRYLAALLLPLACMPCVTRRASRWLLLSPLLLNLLTMYVYQPNVNFQYSFGIIAFLFYAATLNLADLPRPAKYGGTVFSLVACVVAFSMLVLPMIGANREQINDYRERNAVIAETLDKIPKDASVCSTTFFVAHLSDHTELYETYYHLSAGQIKTDCDYYVFDIRHGSDEKQTRQINRLLDNGYRETFRRDNAILVLTRLPAGDDPFTP